MRVAGIIFSNLNDNTLSRLTADRTVAAIPFACRYMLVDFALSNMVNSGITDISVIANYNFRSLGEHIGSGKDWDLARRSGGIRLISPYQTSNSSQTKLYSHHLDALKTMYGYICECREDTIVLSDCDNICNIDLRTIVDEHVAAQTDVTFVTTPCGEGFTSKMPVMMLASSEDGRVTSIAKSDKYTSATPQRSINIFVFRTLYLRKLIEDALAHNYSSMSNDIFMDHPERKKYRTYCYPGYVRPVSSFLDYFTYSIELTEHPAGMRELLLNRERPIFTRVHNSAPCIYRTTANVRSSLIADDCIIEGTVENSVLFRSVKVAKGAVVTNCVLFPGTYIGSDSRLNCIVTDKDVSVTDGTHLSGSRQLPFYVPKGKRV